MLLTLGQTTPLSPYSPGGQPPPPHSASWHSQPCAVPSLPVWAVQGDSLLTNGLQIEQVAGYKETAVSLLCTVLTLSSGSRAPCRVPL